MSFNKVFNSLLCVRGVVLQIILDVYVDNAFHVKLTEDQVRISLKRTFMYLP
jgi:hypothetical protein